MTNSHQEWAAFTWNKLREIFLSIRLDPYISKAEEREIRNDFEGCDLPREEMSDDACRALLYELLVKVGKESLDEFI